MDIEKMRTIKEEANREAAAKQQEIEEMTARMNFPSHHGLIETARRTAKRKIYEKYAVAIPAELSPYRYSNNVRI